MAHDGRLRVRIGHENLGSESLGPWYGGTGAVRLRQVLDNWFWAYTLDDHARRGTAGLPEEEFWRVQECIPAARLKHPLVRPTLDIDVPDADLASLTAQAAPLRTRVAQFGPGMVALFGDFQIERVAGAAIGLFRLGGRRFNAFRTDGGRWTALHGRDMPGVVGSLPSARLSPNGPMSIVEMDDADFAGLLEAAEEL